MYRLYIFLNEKIFFLLSLKISTWLVETIKSSNGDVVLATRAIAKELGMKNDFPVFMAVMDLAWFRPDLVDPASKVRDHPYITSAHFWTFLDPPTMSV